MLLTITPADMKALETRFMEENGIPGALLVRRQDGCVETVLCGDVSVRGLMGYV